MKCHHVTPHHHSLATIYQHISKINNSLVRLHNRCIGTAHHVRPLVLRFEPTGVYMSSQQPISSPLSSPSSTQQGTYCSVCHHTLTDTVPTPAAVVSSSRLNTTRVSDHQQQCKSESILHWTIQHDQLITV